MKATSIRYKNARYPIKEWDGYTFSVEPLAFALMNDEFSNFASDEAESIDNRIAFYFEEEFFDRSSPEELSETWQSGFRKTRGASK